MTASLRATATRARAMPRRLAMASPQALRLDHFRLRTSKGVGRLIEGGTGEFVTTSADLALDIGLADW